MTKLYPYIAFENTKEALEYYEEVFGATEINRLPVTKEQAVILDCHKRMQLMRRCMRNSLLLQRNCLRLIHLVKRRQLTVRFHSC